MAPSAQISTLSRSSNQAVDCEKVAQAVVSNPHRFRIEKVDELDHHGISVGGFYISNNCNTFLLVMALIFIVGGVILTAISYRPRDKYEDMQRYRERQQSDNAEQVKIEGPICVVIGLVILGFSTIFYSISFCLRKQEQTCATSPYELSGREALKRVISVVMTII